MTWREYVEQGEKEMGNTWIETLKKALDIFHGKIKGFKGVVDDLDLRKEFLKAELKILITNLIDKLIEKWKNEAREEERANCSPEQVHQTLQEKFRTLIKRSIEICVEIWEPFFLFNELF